MGQHRVQYREDYESKQFADQRLVAFASRLPTRGGGRVALGGGGENSFSLNSKGFRID